MEMDNVKNNVTILDDLYDEDYIHAVVVSSITSSDEIREIVADVKDELPNDYTVEDILTRLPNDCDIYTKAFGEFAVVSI